MERRVNLCCLWGNKADMTNDEMREKAEKIANKILMDGRLRQGNSTDTIKQALLDARNEALEEAAKLIESSDEVLAATKWYLQKKTSNNTNGRALSKGEAVTDSNPNICQHGSLRRKCDICDLEKQLAEQSGEIELTHMELAEKDRRIAELEAQAKADWNGSIIQRQNRETFELKVKIEQLEQLADKLAGALELIAYGEPHGDNTDNLPGIAYEALKVYKALKGEK